MSANILRFNIKGKTVDIYRNGKTYGNEFFKHCYDYPELIKVKNNKVIVTPNAINEAIEDMNYYIHCKNDEFEDGEITKLEHKNAHEWFDYHSKEINKLFNEFASVLSDDDDWDKSFEGEWTKL